MGAFCSWASAISRRIWPSVVSVPTRVARISSAPISFRVPAKTVSPFCLSTGRLSPVIAAWLTDPVPNRISPSIAIRSPERTMTISPTTSSSRGSVTSFPLRRTVTRSGNSLASASSARSARAATSSSNNPPSRRRTATTAAAEYCPMAMAAIVAIVTGISAVKSPSRIPR
ncbi:MAG: hypothetical protein A4E69_00015 [Syntrophus sp. PtaB.Bin138]|nr:MAG: hypothetical protein A4E69_00015 [Syntrophus sp. PtaB.Bin138]